MTELLLWAWLVALPPREDCLDHAAKYVRLRATARAMWCEEAWKDALNPVPSRKVMELHQWARDAAAEGDRWFAMARLSRLLRK